MVAKRMPCSARKIPHVAIHTELYDSFCAFLHVCAVYIGFLPFDEPSMSTLFRKIQAADFQYPRWFSEDVRSLIDAILVPDSKARLTIAQLRVHPWFNQVRASLLVLFDLAEFTSSSCLQLKQQLSHQAVCSVKMCVGCPPAVIY